MEKLARQRIAGALVDDDAAAADKPLCVVWLLAGGSAWFWWDAGVFLLNHIMDVTSNEQQHANYLENNERGCSTLSCFFNPEYISSSRKTLWAATSIPDSSWDKSANYKLVASGDLYFALLRRNLCETMLDESQVFIKWEKFAVLLVAR